MSIVLGGGTDETETSALRRRVEEYFASDASGPEEPLPEDVLQSLTARLRGFEDRSGGVPGTVGPFAIERVLGRGGMGTVLLGVHRHTGVRAAVKVVPGLSPELVESVLAEARALAEIASTHTVRVLDYGSDGGLVWVAMEYVPGEDLARRIARDREECAREGSGGHGGRHPRPSERVRRVIAWFRDLARALDLLHQKGWIHRDVKPANILISDDGVPYLIDFGLAQSEDGTVEGCLSGTIPYMSPEQAMGGFVSLRGNSDIYSLAVTFYEVLTGRRVVKGSRRVALQEVAFGEVPPPSSVDATIPRSLDPIFAQALAKHPDRRYAGGVELAEDLDLWLEGKVPRHARRGPGRRVADGLRRRKGLVTAVLGAGLVAVALAGWRSCRELGILRDIDRSLAGQDFDEAISASAAAVSAFGGSAAFVERAERAVWRGAALRTRDLLMSLTFSGAGQGVLRSERYAGEAQVLLGVVEDPDLVFQVAFHDLARGRPRDAAAALDRHDGLVRAWGLLTELERTVAVAGADRGRLDRVIARPPARFAVEPDVELCLRALRLLWRHEGRRVGTDADLTALLDELDQVVDDQRHRSGPQGLREHRLLVTLRTGVCLELGLHSRARPELEGLLQDPLRDPERIAVLILLATCILQGIDPAEDARQTDLEEAVRSTLKAQAGFPGAIESIALRLAREFDAGRMDPRPAERWLALTTERLRPGLPPAGDGTFALLARLLLASLGREEDPALLDLAAAVSGLEDRTVPPAARESFEAIVTMQAWASLRAAARCRRNGDRALARHHAGQALRAADRSRPGLNEAAEERIVLLALARSEELANREARPPRTEIDGVRAGLLQALELARQGGSVANAREEIEDVLASLDRLVEESKKGDGQ